MSFCKVKNCRYPDTHVTIGHKCGKCYNFGHGQIECGNNELIESLYNENKNNILPNDKQCNIDGCYNSKLHTTESHPCKYCNKIGNNHMKRCPQLGVPIIDTPPFYSLDPKKITDKQPQLQDGLYMEFYGGMSSTWFARNNKGNIEFLFMHSDNWGQYSEDTSDIPRLNAFLESYSKVLFDSSVKYDHLD